MKIISHRGAAGLAPENTILGIKLAREYEVDYIEIDVQRTKDGQLAVFHDDSVAAKSGPQLKIKDTTLAELRQKSSRAHKIPSLAEALDAAGDIPLLIDCKNDGWEEPLIKILKDFKGPVPIIASDDSNQLFSFKQKMPSSQCFLSELTKPFEAIQTAKVLKFSGVCLLYSIYNPIVYFKAKRDKLRMTMYTVNRPAYGWFLHFFYPEVLITTDFPNKFVSRKKRRKLRK